MGCGNSKTEAFVGTADAEIQHYCNIIGELSGYNWEQGSGPVARTDEALRNIHRIAEENNNLQHATIDLFAAVTEAMRIENAGLFGKFLAEFNKARIAVCGKAAPSKETDAFEQEVAGLWLPRVVRLDPDNSVLIGSSHSVGLCSISAVLVGYCVECWVRVISKPPNKSEPAVSFLTTIGNKDPQSGANPNFYLQQDGRVVMDFCKTPLVIKKPLFEFGHWNHVAFVVGQGQMRILINGKRVGERQCPHIWGEVALRLQAYVPVEICEYRIWNTERSDAEIQECLGLPISPRVCEDYKALRYCWLPIRRGSPLYSPGSLWYDTWSRHPAGCRVVSSDISDSRWPCALPPLMTHTVLDLNHESLVVKHVEEIAHARETREINLHAMMMYDPPLPFTPLDTKAQLIACALMMDGGPWIPRVVTLTPGIHANLGTAAELGIAVHPDSSGTQLPSQTDTNPADVWSKSYYSKDITGFTVECWVRVRALHAGQDNCVIGYGTGAPHSIGQSLYIVIRDGRPVMGFVGAEFEIASDVIIPPMQWAHVGFSCDREGKQFIYINGVLIGTHTSKLALSGDCALTLGACGDGNSFQGDICELRIWNRVFHEADIAKYMNIAIPPLAGHAHKGLRLSWLPLRNGGPSSQLLFSKVSFMFEERSDTKHEGALTGAAAAAATAFKSEMKAIAASDLKHPAPSLLWDIDRKTDFGILTHSITLLTTRTRVPPVQSLIPTKEYLPKHWSKSAVALIDDWSDAYDRMFIPSWPMPHMIDQAGNALIPPPSAGAAVARSSPWIPRVLVYKSEIPLSCKIGSTAELGLGSIGAMGRQFTLEVWIRPRTLRFSAKKILFQDIFGHEDEVSNRGTLLFGLGRPEALRIGLANGYPFITFGGAPKSLKPNDIKDCGCMAPYAIPSETWSHLSFGVDGNGVMRITIDGKTVVERNKTGALKAKGDHMLYAFGYKGREILSDVCELRMWSSYRTEDEVFNFMHMGLTPLDTGGARVPNLRLCWFPLRSMRSVLWDTKMLMHRVCYHDVSRPVGPHLTRRPCFLPTFITSSLTALPAAPILDDRGDAFERIFLPDLVPPVVRHKRPPGSASDLVADVDYTAIDWDFLPFSSSGAIAGIPQTTQKKKDKKASSGLGLAAAKTRKEKENLDIGWRDIDDGTWTENSGFDFDDGGYLHIWGGVDDLRKELQSAEVYDASVRLSLDSSDTINNVEARKMSNASEDNNHDFEKGCRSPSTEITHSPSAGSSSNTLNGHVQLNSAGVIDTIKENPPAFPAAVSTVQTVIKLEQNAHSAGKKLPPLDPSPRTESPLQDVVDDASISKNLAKNGNGGKRERQTSRDAGGESSSSSSADNATGKNKQNRRKKSKESSDAERPPIAHNNN